MKKNRPTSLKGGIGVFVGKFVKEIITKQIFSLAILALVMLPSIAFSAATLTVGTGGSGATYTTFADAIAASTSGDTIELWSNMSESVYISNNGKRLNYTSKAGNVFTWDSTGANPTLKFTAMDDVPASSATVSNIVFNHSSGDAYTLSMTHKMYMDFVNCTFLRDSTGGTYNSIFNSGEDLVHVTFSQCKFLANGNTTINGFYKSGANTSDNTMGLTATNTLFAGFTGTGMAAIYLNNNNAMGFRLLNCTVANSYYGVYDVCSVNNPKYGSIINTLFVNNGTDYDTSSFSSGKVVGMVTDIRGRVSYSAFGQTNTAGAWGTRVIFVTNANEVINVSSDFHLIVGAQSINSGTDIGAPLIDIESLTRPHITTDIGAYEYYSSADLTATQIIIDSRTPTPSYTITPTFTITPTPTLFCAIRHIVGNPSGTIPYTDCNSQVWSADQAYTTGSWGYTVAGTALNQGNVTTGPACSADLTALYQPERYNAGGPVTYRYDVQDGNYQIILKFAETYSGAQYVGGRTFDITINGTTVATKFDIYKEAGAGYKGVDKAYYVTIAGSPLTISFVSNGGANNPKIDAIEVLSNNCELSPTSTVTPTSTNTQIATSTSTRTKTVTNTVTNTFTASPTITVSPTITNSPTITASPTITNSPTNTVTKTVTNTVTDTVTMTLTPT